VPGPFGANPGNGALAIVFGRPPMELVGLRQWAIPAVAGCHPSRRLLPSQGPRRTQGHEKPRTGIRSGVMGTGPGTGASVESVDSRWSLAVVRVTFEVTLGGVELVVRVTFVPYPQS
jgi:hypothetical protein